MLQHELIKKKKKEEKIRRSATWFVLFQSEGGSEKEQSESSTSQTLDLGFPDDDDEPNNPEGTVDILLCSLLVKYACIEIQFIAYFFFVLYDAKSIKQIATV